MNIWNTIKEIIQLCEVDEAIDKPSEQRLLFLLDSLAFQMHSIEPFGEFKGKEIPENNYDDIRNAISKRFSNWGYYNTVSDVTLKIAETEVLTGDAIDDITDIINDLKMAVWSHENENEQTAIWHLQDSYHYHWREHLRNLQFYIHCLENKI